tara:strand:+ start:249 stop:1103 length:855 start_codon:yes stop_codon:yes gene_type:complete
MWEKVFKTVGYNPENIEMVIKRALEVDQIIIEQGFEIAGASATYNRKGIWSKNPKLTLVNSSGKDHKILPKPAAPREAKMLIALLYSLCHMNSIIDKAHVFYNDKKGTQATSIASKHGPEKSEYMKSLIRGLNDEEMIARLNESIETPLPEELTPLQRKMISNLSEGYLTDEIAHRLMTSHKCSARELEDEIDSIRRVKGITDRHIPSGIKWGSLKYLDHEDLLEEAVSTAIEAAEREIDTLATTLEAIEEKRSSEMASKVSTLEQRIEFLENRGLIARIFNKF